MDRELHLSDLNFAKLRAIIHDHTSISIGDGRKSLLLSRLRGRLRDIAVPDFKSYIALVTSDPGEMQELIDRVTTNKTYFHRTPRIWDHFRNVAVAEFLSRKSSGPMRIWSAAASTGEEAHTAGILLEDVRTAEDQFDYRILGSDISARVLKAAKAGAYRAQAIAAFRTDRPDLVETYLPGNDTAGYEVAGRVRSRISFKYHNLRDRMTTTSPFDVVFLRNVLIYFTVADQERILANIRATMAPEGTLYIGESESISRLDTDFDIVEPMVYRPRGAASGAGA